MERVQYVRFQLEGDAKAGLLAPSSTKPLYEHKVDMLTSSTKVVKAKLVHDESKDRG